MANLLRLLGNLRPYAGSVVLALVLSFLVAGLTSLSLSTLIPILETLFSETGLTEFRAAAARALSVLGEGFSQWVVESLLDTRMAVLSAMLMAVLVITVLKGVLRFFDEYIVGKVSVAAGRDLTATLFAHLARQPPLFVEREGVGNISGRFAADGDQVIRGLRTVTGTFLREPLQFLFLLLLALLISPLLTASSLLIFPLIGLLIRQAGRVARRHAKQVLIHRASLLSIVQDVFFSIRLVQSCRAEDRARARFERENRLLFDRERRLARAEAVSSPVIEVLVVVGVGATLLIGGAMAIRGEISASRLVVLYVAVGALYEPVRKVAAAVPRIQACLAASARIFAFIDREPEIRDGPDAVPLPPITEEVLLRDVTVTYGGRAEALRGVDLSIPAGSWLALVGPSGSGKSTLVALLPRLLDPEEGEIVCDGRDLREATLDSVRSRILLVSQDPLILNETVRENVLLARPEATDGELADALRAARVSEFAGRLPAGLDTVVGERGATLSGGQRQRLALARAILADPDVLVLDEAFSQIDEDQANAVLAEFRARRAKRTTVLITHRVEAVAGADRIAVLAGGRLVAHGRHEELLAGCKVYRDLLAAAEAARTGGNDDRQRST
jgi:ABC-type multidrug transport system fused ATPase/permease subunit